MKIKNSIIEEEKDLKDYERHEINPFLTDLALQMQLKTKYISVKTTPADEMIVSKATNEPVANLSNVLMRRTYIDKSSLDFIELCFLSLFLSVCRHVIFKLDTLLFDFF